MIGFDTGGPGGGGSGWRAPAPDALDTIGDAWQYVRDRTPEILQPVFGFVERTVGAFRWVLERVLEVYPVHFDRWQVHADERLCPECGAMGGVVQEEGVGIYPPLHVNCRCERWRAWTEWRSRYVDAWRLRWVSWSEWEWRVTGWRWEAAQ